MNGNTIIVANKIITSEDLFAMFQLMNNNVKKYQRIYEEEKLSNKKYEYNDQTWTVGNLNVNQYMVVTFNDNSKINYDNYDKFMNVLYERIEDVVFINFGYDLVYAKIKNGECKNIMQGMGFEDRFEINLNTANDDDRVADIYNEIKTIIDDAPEKYDRVIKRKNFISNKMGVGVGLLFSIILSTTLLNVTKVKKIYTSNFAIYPACTFALGLVLGIILFSTFFKRLYKNLIPKHYNKEMYKKSCEIHIGKNTNSL